MPNSDSDLFGQLVDSAPDALILVGQDGLIRLVNRRAEELFGYERSELLGQPIELLVPEHFRPAHAGHRQGYLSAPKRRPMGSELELCGRRRDGGQFPVEVSLSPIAAAEGTLVAAAIRDVSLRKRAEQRFRAL